MKRIYYKINNPVNLGTEEDPNWAEDFVSKSLPYSEANEEIAREEAYNGAYTVEDDGLPEPDTATTDDVLNALLGVSE